ncbi:MAG: aminotransferase class V-fold PLP-dependent enzyme [Alphaproteobacteria bacterium]|nr:aminotransferase class V-fold PLP-dependent enzyme [Alphaproteobacteria bacterium]
MNKIIYLDAAASYQKSNAIIDAEADFLRNRYANAGRGICGRAAAVDDMVTTTRQKVAKFINADVHQVVFTAGATDGLNRIVSMLKPNANTVVAVSDIDHHSARLPWVGAGTRIAVCDLYNNFNIDVSRVPYADIMVITAMSNVLGVAQDVAAIIKAARNKNPNVITIVDAAQFVVHDEIDVKKWDCDFMVFSAHKIGADTGLGILYIKNPDLILPDKFGGGMVARVAGNKMILNIAPERFEAGTLPLTQIAGLGIAIDEIKHNRPNLDLIKYMYDELSQIPRIRILSARTATILTFVVDGMHVLDFGAMVGARGVCLRVGTMCASWIHERLGVDGSVRISVGAYNTTDEVATAVQIIKGIVK